jgi:dimethylsulfone monooxygenase
MGLEDGKAKVEEMRRRIGREDFSRDFQIWTSCRVVCRPTEREARDYAQNYIHEKGDFVAIETIIAEQGRRDPNMPHELYDRIKRRMVAGWGGYPLVGTAEQIVDELGRLSRAGLDRVLLRDRKIATRLRRDGAGAVCERRCRRD